MRPLLYTLYLLAAVSFIIALKQLSHPRSALRGNRIGALGMSLAIVATVLLNDTLPPLSVFVALAAGGLVGLVLALRIQFTAMPQLVAIFNGFGGVASTLVASAVLYYGSQLQAGGAAAAAADTVAAAATAGTAAFVRAAVVASGVIGSVTLTGSLIAFAKLQGLVSEKAIRYPGGTLLKLLAAAAVVGGVVWIIREPQHPTAYWAMSAAAGLLGILMVVPIGGADMPVVIALLNSYSGLAATATGFALNNVLLVISGTMVGASGIILTRIMCRAMNRSLANVLLGGVGGVVQQSGSADDFYEGKVRTTSADEVALLLDSATSVVIVPGYGMAVAHAQSAVKTLMTELESQGTKVSFGIHPVAGRMPGHMNVLLAEERISYEKMVEMDQINPSLPNIDLAIVIGANDVVNPVARNADSGPLSGMPIINVDEARTVIVLKRSLSPGFAGVHNPLFINEKTLMFFEDGKRGIEGVTKALKENK